MEDDLNPTLHTLLAELAAFGDAHDSDAANRANRMLNITPDTGEFLAVLVKATRAPHPRNRDLEWLFDALAGRCRRQPRRPCDDGGDGAAKDRDGAPEL